MSKMHQLSRYGSRSVLARACSAVSFQPLEKRTLLSAALALDWGGVDNAYEVAVDGRGRIVVTGDSDDALVMARFTRTGESLDLDEGFGTEGGVALDFEPFGIEIQPDGKILLVGDDAEGTLLVARYNEDGTLDTSFADDGTAEFNLAPDSFGNAIGIEPGGKIVVAGGSGDDLLVVRFERDGDLDTTFGGGGFVTTDFGGTDVALGLGILSDGRIAVGGASDDTDYVIARYLPTGALDPTLDGAAGDGNGKISGKVQDYDQLDDLPVKDFIALPDGRMFVLADGTDDPGITDDGVVYPFTPDGKVMWEDIDPLFRVGPHDEIAAHGYDYAITTSWHDEETTDETGWHNHDFFAFGERTDFGGDDTDGLEFDEYVLGVALRDGVGAAVGVTGEDWGMYVDDYAPAQGSYTGAPHGPGETIQAEDFDYGGEGVSYHDDGVTNQGGEYRVGAVDLGYTSDTGGGFAVGYTQGGEWLEYSIDVPEDGTYRIETRVANPASGARFYYEIGGTNVGGSVTVPATGGWHSFATVSSDEIELEAGEQVLRLVMDAAATNGAVANFNWLRFVAVDDGGGDPGGPRDRTFGDGGTVDGPVDDEPAITPVNVAVGPQDVIVATGHRTVVRYLADGSVDTSFGGGDGEIETDFDNIYGVAVQGDGRIVAVGEKDNVFRVARYTTSGQLDTSFSGDGITSRGFGGQGGFDAAYGVAIQPDGRIVVVGGGTTARRPSDTGIVIVRYNPNGSIDPSFDNDGYSVEQLSIAHDWATDVDIAPDGRIVVSGISGMDGRVLRYNRNGSLDTTFSGDGVASVPFIANSVDTQGDGRVVVGGVARESMADFGDRVARFTTAGVLDPSFGTGGVVADLFEIEDGYSSDVSDVLVLSGGDIMVTGSNEDRSNDSAFGVVTRLNPDGSIDEQFDSDRDYEIAFGSRGHAHALALQSTGSTIVAGDTELIRLELARYLTGDDGGGEPGGDGTGLTGTYFSNADFSGNSLTRTDAAVNFDWGTGGPSSTIGTDTFSARWTGQVEAQKTEQYTFYTNTDDGVRLWVDGQLLVNMWVPQGETEWSGTINLVAGQKYDITMEYFERYGSALAELRWSSPSTPKQVVPTSQLFPSGTGTPADTQKPTTPPNLKATADHERVILDWDDSSDNVGVVSYEILRNSVRIATVGASQTTYTDTNVDPDNGYGYDVIAIDAAGNRSDEAFVNIMTPPAPPHVGQGLQGVYYSNIDFTGSTVTRTDSTINFDWGSGGPSSTIGTDTFSVRWTGQILADKTEGYLFHTRTDDGVRLWVDGQLIIDQWLPQSATEHSGSIDLVAGQKYDIKMEYFERYGGALAELRWSSATTPKEIVPESHLFATQAPDSEPEPEGGLWALIYDNMDFTDHVLTRRVSDVNFDWGSGSPDALIDADMFSVHFTGRVKPTKTERYTFYTQSDDGVRLRVNGQTLIDRLVPQSMTEHSGVIELEAGKEYEIGLDYFERFGSAAVKLLWSSASTPKQVIPSENLEPGGILL